MRFRFQPCVPAALAALLILFAAAPARAQAGTDCQPGYAPPQGQYVPVKRGLFGRVRRVPAAAPQPMAAAQYVAPRAMPAPQPAPAPATASDAIGFLNWLNATRASYGLAPVAYDPALEADTHHNNLWQAIKGLGHHWMGSCRRQNAAWNLNFPGVESAWMNSPGHCAALLDPSITRIAITWHGAWCTFAAY